MRNQFPILDLLTLVLVIPAVVIIFRLVPDRRVAATCAGCLFVFVPLALMIYRMRKPLSRAGARTVWWIGILQFWLLFAVPILSARLIWWDRPFESFTFFGMFSGPTWHSAANGSYVTMLVLIVLAGLVGRGRVAEK